MITFAIVTRAGLTQEDSIEREFWQAAYIAAIHAKMAGETPAGAADRALFQFRKRRADMSAAEPVSS